ncbi:hypothetical protein HRbin32_02092 [bacterium HR32]|nr:hypothetical protein HRbin32_02092 [bacterium HR32]
MRSGRVKRAVREWLDTRPSMQLACGCVATPCPCCPGGVVLIADAGACQVGGSVVLHQALLEHARREWDCLEMLVRRADHVTPCDGGAG